MLSDDDTIDLRKGQGKGTDEVDEGEFRIKNIENGEDLMEDIDEAITGDAKAGVEKSPDKIKLKFDKFVNLIATHAYEDIFDEHADDDIIISTNLLTDLANAHAEKKDNKMPLIFIIGAILGVALTWLFFSLK